MLASLGDEPEPPGRVSWPGGAASTFRKVHPSGFSYGMAPNRPWAGLMYAQKLQPGIVPSA